MGLLSQLITRDPTICAFFFVRASRIWAIPSPTICRHVYISLNHHCNRIWLCSTFLGLTIIQWKFPKTSQNKLQNGAYLPRTGNRPFPPPAPQRCGLHHADFQLRAQLPEVIRLFLAHLANVMEMARLLGWTWWVDWEKGVNNRGITVKPTINGITISRWNMFLCLS